MKIFVTGASGFIGSAVVKELLMHGHEVTGLARSKESAEKLSAMGAAVQMGALEDLESLKAGVRANDAVIHLAFLNDFSSAEAFYHSGTVDVEAIEAMGEVLAGTDKPLVITSGIAGIKNGHFITEQDVQDEEATKQSPRRSEVAASQLKERHINVSIVRLPPTVYGNGRAGFTSMLIALAKQTGESAYVADGTYRWSGVHYEDAASLFRLAVEKGGRFTYHGVGDEAIEIRRIAEVIGKRLSIPVAGIPVAEAAQHFGPITPMAMLDCPAYSEETQQSLNWKPVHTDFLHELEHESVYFE